MTAEDFDMRPLNYIYLSEWRITISGCDISVQADVSDDDVQKCIEDNFDGFSDTFRKELLQRVDNKWDLNEITDEEKELFLRVLEKVLP